MERRPFYLLILGLKPLDGHSALPPPEDSIQVLNWPSPEIARPDGWTFVTAFPGSGQWFKAKKLLVNGIEDIGYRRIRVDHHGVFAFRTLLEHLQWDIPERWRKQRPEAPGMIYPHAIIDATVSVLRLAARLWREHLHNADLHALLRLTGTSGWLLPP